jgi:hypothetical protein
VASSNAQQVNPAYIALKPAKETAEADNIAVKEKKTAEVAEKKNGSNFTQIPPHQQTGTSFATPRVDPEVNKAQQKSAEGLLTADSVSSLHKGQMRKTTFLESLRAEITRTIEPVLATVGQTTKDCPYLNYWLDLYHHKDAAHIEQTVKKYAPDSISATTAEEYISIVTQRALRAAVIWAKTGRLSGIPPGVPTTLPGEAPARSRRAVLTKAKSGGARVNDPHAVQQQLGQGQPLSSGVRSRMETAFGTSFQHVRAHTDSIAGSVADSINARAFTVGHHVAFGAGEYQPGTILGDALIAHELAHVVQQQGAANSIGKMDTASTDYNALEHDADVTAANVVSSLWAGTTRNVVSNLRTGLRLQGCCKQPEIPRQTVKTLTVDLIKMRGSNRTPADDLAKANEIFAHASVNFTVGRSETITDVTSDTWLGGDTDLVTAPACSAVSSEETAMFDGATTLYSLSSRMRVFYVATISGQSALAYSIPPYCAIGDAAPYVNHAVIKNAAHSDTMAHEFGHILLNNEVHHGVDDPNDSCNIMYAPGRTGSVIDASQAATIYNNA